MPQNFSRLEQDNINSLGQDEIDKIKDISATEEGEEEDRIAKSMIGQVLFITGGTGFLGKVLIEKLLRACPGIKKIYVLIREKKGKSAEERLKEMFQNELFGLLKTQRSEEEIFQKVEAIPGDVLLPGLGLSEESEKKLVEEATIVYHCAATIRFDEPLRKAVLINVRGTKFMLELGRKCKKLQLFGYMSTAYCHLNVEHVMEQPYDPPADPENIIKLCEILDEATMDSITDSLLGNYPNSYAFTKCLAEDLVVKTFDDLPSGILRPSIVIPIWKEPLPGWTDNINGPAGLLIGAGKGVIRTMHCDEKGYGDYLPVDIAVNGIIIASWYILYFKNFTNRVGHMTSSKELVVSWSEIIEIGRWVIENKIPLNGVAWYPGGSMKKSRLVHNICMVLFHWIPAIIVDTLLWCLGYPPVLCRVQRRISKGFQVFEYYTNRKWSFDNTEALKMRQLLNDYEKKKYIIEKKDLDLIEYFTQCTLCTRRYILKTPDDMIPAARRHMKMLWVVDRTCKLLFIVGVAYYIYTRLLYRFFENISEV